MNDLPRIMTPPGADTSVRDNTAPPIDAKPLREMQVRRIARELFSQDGKTVCGYRDQGGLIEGDVGQYNNVIAVFQQFMDGEWHDVEGAQ